MQYGKIISDGVSAVALLILGLFCVCPAAAWVALVVIIAALFIVGMNAIDTW